MNNWITESSLASPRAGGWLGRGGHPSRSVTAARRERREIANSEILSQLAHPALGGSEKHHLHGPGFLVFDA
jgi:hypothetical protein